MKRIALVLAAVCLLLSGCVSWMEGNYVSITPYMSPDDSDGQDIHWISNKEQLFDAVRDMVNSGDTDDLFFVRDYGESALNTDKWVVRYNIMNNDPVGAYSVQDIQFELGVNGGRSTLAVNIEYSRQKSEILRMKTLTQMEDVKNALAAALSGMETELVFYMEGYQNTDFAQMVENYARENPNEVIEIPRVGVSLYPDAGANRVVELSFSYQTDRDSLRIMQSHVQQIFESAKLYVSGVEEDEVVLSRLYVFLTGGIDVNRILGQNRDSSITPAYSLLRYGIGDSKAFATVYAAMCRQVGLECITVSGTRNGDAWFWNIVKDGERYAHVDLLRCAAAGYFQLRSDAQMDGYVWDYLAYPACGAVYLPPEEEETTQAQTEAETEGTMPPETAETEPPEEE